MAAQICASATLFPLIAPIAGDYISIDQSALTGESLPVSKKRCLFQPLRAPSSVWREAALLVMRVHELAPEKVWSTRYGEINQFEKLIVGQNKTTILKFFLHIFKEERLTRFAKRVDDPARQWKISESDYKERDYWDDYIEAFEDVPGENEHRARALVRDSFKS